MTDAAEKIEVTDEEFELQLPRPVGYRLLVAMPEVEQTFGDSGILKADSTKHQDYITSIIGLVVDAGEQAYADKDRFQEGPWCKVGDYVVFRMNTGTRFKVNGKEFRLMNDDSIEAVIPDPRVICNV